MSANFSSVAALLPNFGNSPGIISFIAILIRTHSNTRFHHQVRTATNLAPYFVLAKRPDANTEQRGQPQLLFVFNRQQCHLNGSHPFPQNRIAFFELCTSCLSWLSAAVRWLASLTLSGAHRQVKAMRQLYSGRPGNADSSTELCVPHSCFDCINSIEGRTTRKLGFALFRAG